MISSLHLYLLLISSIIHFQLHKLCVWIWDPHTEKLLLFSPLIKHERNQRKFFIYFVTILCDLVYFSAHTAHKVAEISKYNRDCLNTGKDPGRWRKNCNWCTCGPEGQGACTLRGCFKREKIMENYLKSLVYDTR